MKIKTLVLASAALLVATSAAEAGYYAGADVGIAMPKKEKLNEGGYKTSFKADDGFVGDIIGGYNFGNNIRAELDLGMRRYSMDKVANVQAGGRINSYALTANVFYDFNNKTKLTPFLGIGAGAARTKMKINDASLVNSALVGSKSDTSTKFAMQGTAGIAYKITDALSASLAYRYFTTLNQKFESAEYDLISHEVLFGLRYEFGACKKNAENEVKESAVPVVAAAAPAVAAAAAESDVYAITPKNVWDAYAPIEGSKEYTLYFRNNSYFISDSDKKILADAVAEYNKLGNVKIKIDGSADALGTAKYNKALSERRALATEQALVEMGIDAGEILTRGEGIIGTKPNPSNRRVDIYFAK
jgi:opacity protein-like surface antigen